MREAAGLAPWSPTPAGSLAEDDMREVVSDDVARTRSWLFSPTQAPLALHAAVSAAA